MLRHRASHLRRVFGWGLASLVAVCLMLLGSMTAVADQGRTVQVQIPYHTDVTNLCNNQIVNVHGVLTTTITTTPTSDGGYTILAWNIAPDMVGETMVGGSGPYRADQGEVNFQVIPPSTKPTRVYDATWLTMVPQGSGPTMYLVTLFAVTVYPDETFKVNLQKTYMVCTAPR
jgi:hypothetical protein